MQEPKYEFREGKVFNRASGEQIPDDEPIFILRARDIHAADAIHTYGSRCADPEHRKVIKDRWRDFMDFRLRHPDRMKEPDSDKPAIDEARSS